MQLVSRQGRGYCANRLILFGLILILRKMWCSRDEAAGQVSVCPTDGAGKWGVPRPAEHGSVARPRNVHQHGFGGSAPIGPICAVCARKILHRECILSLLSNSLLNVLSWD